ncbi:TVG1229743 [Thermoplasma volcanium GSS1]|uniref:TVG1229743 protein n=1 Tax=Thermoplasma volcanium (strain ATCC 51530 / DSM 4299 / JCM 9571 / NBRC 15438 / GSS1) TaxID=273116 RepID=Q979G1_THEVO|nr:TVG1229743 [Thermoplasma volcanium GSS1]
MMNEDHEMVRVDSYIVYICVCYKAITQNIPPSDKLKDIMYEFTGMVNFMLNIIVDKNIISRYSLSK